jgi:hypothetical protein
MNEAKLEHFALNCVHLDGTYAFHAPQKSLGKVSAIFLITNENSLAALSI